MPANPNPTAPGVVYRRDYRPPDYRVETVHLRFELDEEKTRVVSRMTVVANREEGADQVPLVLNGEQLQLLSVALDGQLLNAADYELDAERLVIRQVPGAFTLEVETEINPAANTSLEGLYLSSSNFCTQCEAEGFRRITYFPDRPDVMARYTTTIVADRVRYPVLLSNGNLIESGELEEGRHFAVWQDPFPKPSYLFALVAGDLARIEDQFVTMSGRKVDLHMYVQHHNIDQCDHAMNALKKAMEWDEETFGREYDLDLFMIVAVDDFNMGAMENKGLNIFNSSCVLAKAESATDADFQSIEGIVGHEYFHNWSGNRVTCRDWFQLSLKEGFTVFRDQQFSADMWSRDVKRIHDVNMLRNAQFREDAGPMAHPVRPESYVEISNFYTPTVYIKGAEVVRMLHRLLGSDRFRRGTDLYFERHDGQAVTTDDFVSALEDANGVDFGQFRLWYSQAGTPVLQVSPEYDAKEKTYTLTVTQHCPGTPGQSDKQPFHIPLAMGLVGSDGRDLPLRLAGEGRAVTGTRVLQLRERRETFVFQDVEAAPVPSVLRGFSAPVKLDMELGDDERGFLMANDTDPFNRWEAGQQLAVKHILGLVSTIENGDEPTLDPGFCDAFGAVLHDPGLDGAFVAQAFTLPSEIYLAECMEVMDPVAIHEARRSVRLSLARALGPDLLARYEELEPVGPYVLDSAAVAARSLRNVCLGYLMELEDPQIRQRCVEQFRGSDNMTDTMAALSCLANDPAPEREQALGEFYDRWRSEPLVIDKWLALQATSRLPDTLAVVRRLTEHPAFSIRNPNRVRALIGAFCQRNPARFHAPDGEGYRFLGDQILQLDPLNPQIAARLAGAFGPWRRLDENRQGLIRAQLERILAAAHVSKDVYEIVSKSLA
ncbi:MAG: aminopeptidase N [Gammaproteobacteria bacterium]